MLNRIILGQLFVIPEMVAKKIKELKENGSLGINGIPPDLPKVALEQISIPNSESESISESVYYRQLDCTHSHDKIHKATQV